MKLNYDCPHCDRPGTKTACDEAFCYQCGLTWLVGEPRVIAEDSEPKDPMENVSLQLKDLLMKIRKSIRKNAVIDITATITTTYPEENDE